MELIMPIEDYLKPYFTLPHMPHFFDSDVKFMVTPESLLAFAEGGPKQGYIGLAELPDPDDPNADQKLVKIHLVPSFNRNDGKAHVNAEGKPFTHGSIESTQELGSLTGDSHTFATAKLGLGLKGGARGLLMGFGIWKSGCGIRLTESLPSENARVANELILEKNPSSGKWTLYRIKENCKDELVDIASIRGLANALTNLPDKPVSNLTWEDRQDVEHCLRSSYLGAIETGGGIGFAKNRSSSQNPFVCQYSEMYRLFFSVFVAQHGAHALNLPRELPFPVFEKILETLTKDLGCPPLTDLANNRVIPSGWIGPRLHFGVERHWQVSSAEQRKQKLFDSAVMEKLFETVRFMLERGEGDPNIPVRLDEESQRLLEQHFWREDSAKEGVLPLQIALYGEPNKELVEILLRHGADPLKHWLQRTPLSQALESNHIDLFFLMLNYVPDQVVRAQQFAEALQHARNVHAKTGSFESLQLLESLLFGMLKALPENPEFQVNYLKPIVANVLESPLHITKKEALLEEILTKLPHHLFLDCLKKTDPIKQSFLLKQPTLQKKVLSLFGNTEREALVELVNYLELDSKLFSPRVYSATQELPERLDPDRLENESAVNAVVETLETILEPFSNWEKQAFYESMIEICANIPNAYHVLIRVLPPEMRGRGMSACLPTITNLDDVKLQALCVTMAMIPEEQRPVAVVFKALYEDLKEQDVIQKLLPLLTPQDQIKVLQSETYNKLKSREGHLRAATFLNKLPPKQCFEVLRQVGGQGRTLLEDVFCGYRYPEPKEFPKLVNGIKSILLTLPDEDKVKAFIEKDKHGLTAFHFTSIARMLPSLLSLVPPQDRVAVLLAENDDGVTVLEKILVDILMSNFRATEQEIQEYGEEYKAEKEQEANLLRDLIALLPPEDRLQVFLKKNRRDETLLHTLQNNRVRVEVITNLIELLPEPDRNLVLNETLSRGRSVLRSSNEPARYLQLLVCLPAADIITELTKQSKQGTTILDSLQKRPNQKDYQRALELLEEAKQQATPPSVSRHTFFAESPKPSSTSSELTSQLNLPKGNG
jgi:hypothetical protein